MNTNNSGDHANSGALSTSCQQLRINALATLIESGRPVYAVNNIKNVSRSSIVKEVGSGTLEVSSLDAGVIPPQDSCVLDVSSLLAAAGEQPVIYLGLQDDAGEPLGRVRIRLTCGPRRREQMLGICMAQEGWTWKGSWFSRAIIAAEGLGCFGCMTPDGERSDTAIVQDLEEDDCEINREGHVTGYTGVGFMVCTRTVEVHTKGKMPEVGRVLSGLDLLRRYIDAEDDYWFARPIETTPMIVEAGIEITL